MTTDPSPQSVTPAISANAQTVDLNAPLMEDVGLAGVAVLAFSYAAYLLFPESAPALPLVAVVVIMLVMAGVKLNRDGKRIRIDEGNGSFQIGHQTPVPFSQVELRPARVMGGKGVALFQFSIQTPNATATVTNQRGAVLRRKWNQREVDALTVLINHAGTEEFQRSWKLNWVPVLLNRFSDSNPDSQPEP